MGSVDFLNVEYIYYLIYRLLTGGDTDPELIIARAKIVWNTYTTIAMFACFLFIVGTIYSLIRLHQIRKEENEVLEGLMLEAIKTKESPQNARWDNIVRLVGSFNEHEWRQAIIEADIMLDEMVSAMALPGETLGEKLKVVEKSDFNTINEAWEAHKVRNALAHEGTNYVLNQREARRVIDLYKKVFDEFRFV